MHEDLGGSGRSHDRLLKPAEPPPELLVVALEDGIENINLMKIRRKRLKIFMDEKVGIGDGFVWGGLEPRICMTKLLCFWGLNMSWFRGWNCLREVYCYYGCHKGSCIKRIRVWFYSILLGDYIMRVLTKECNQVLSCL